MNVLGCNTSNRDHRLVLPSVVHGLPLAEEMARGDNLAMRLAVPAFGTHLVQLHAHLAPCSRQQRSSRPAGAPKGVLP